MDLFHACHHNGKYFLILNLLILNTSFSAMYDCIYAWLVTIQLTVERVCLVG